MLDIRWIRENPEAFDTGLARRGAEPQSAVVLRLDEERRAILTRLQDLQNRRNQASKEIGKAKAAGDGAAAQALIDEVADLKGSIQADEEAAKAAEAALDTLLAGIPNMPADDVPDGPDETANVEQRKWGTPQSFSFAPRQHFEIGESLRMMDFEAAAKLSGSRFVVLSGGLARLERALGQFMLDLHTGEFGYTEVSPPLMVRSETMFGTGQLPKFGDDLFATHTLDLDRFWPEYDAALGADLAEADRAGMSRDEAEERAQARRRHWKDVLFSEDYDRKLWLIPTAEVSLTNLVRESILPEDELPIRVTAHTACFRAEAGAAGRDTRGMIRQHQFAKVELVSITTPEQSGDELERMVSCAEEVLKRLDLPYRVMLLSSGDMGFSARKTYDIEVWLPGQDTYREISSCSVCGDFQARRMNARYRPGEGGGPRFVHTLNGSGLAVGRTLVAILENYQEEDGAVRVPEALRPYMSGIERIALPAEGTR